MNLQSWFKQVAGAFTRTPAAAGFFRQIRLAGLSFADPMKLFRFCFRSLVPSPAWGTFLACSVKHYKKSSNRTDRQASAIWQNSGINWDTMKIFCLLANVHEPASCVALRRNVL
jgi:hypothetical protein